MNPYQPPSSHVDEQSESESNELADPLHHPYYAHVLKMVLWGDDKAAVFKAVEVGGLTCATADLLYACARQDRVSSIRAFYRQKLLIGMALMFAATVVFVIFWFGLGFILRIIIYVCSAVFGKGAWKGIDGVAGFLMAAHKEGSVADDY